MDHRIGFSNRVGPVSKPLTVEVPLLIGELRVNESMVSERLRQTTLYKKWFPLVKMHIRRQGISIMEQRGMNALTVIII